MAQARPSAAYEEGWHEQGVDLGKDLRAKRLAAGLGRAPRGEDVKAGTLRRLGWAHETAEDVGIGWSRILERVASYKDLEPSLLGRMEELIDFVTAKDSN